MKKPLLHHLQDYFFPHRRNNNRPNLFSLASVGALVLAVIVFEAGYLVQTKIVFLKTDFLASVLPGALVALTNQDRATGGIPGVTEDPLLDKAAQAAAEDMAAKGYFAHVSPDGKSPWYWLEQVGYHYSYAGENLAVNFTDSSGVEMAWMNSPTHRANIEKPQYTRVGIGTANGMYEGKETTFVVQFFAAPAAEKLVPARIALATPIPIEQTSTSTTPVKVLGSQTVGTDNSGAAAAAAPTPAKPSLLARILAAPLSTIETIFTVLFALIASFFTIAILVRGRVRLQHPSVVFGGAFLLLLISGAMLVSATFAGSVLLPAGGQAASVYMALP
jgi:hypothetical protein